MQRVFRGASCTVEKVADGGSAPPRKSLGRNGRKSYSKEPQVSAIILRNSEQRCFIVTLVTVEHDASWKFLAPMVLPLQEADHRNCLASGDQSKMDGALPISQPPAILSDQQKVDGGEDHASPANSSTDSSLSGASVPSWNKGPVNRGIKGSQVSSSYCQKNYDGLIDSSSASSPPGLTNDAQKISKSTKRNSKKKAKKKGKQHKKHSSHSIGANAARKEGIHDTSIFDTCSENNSAWDRQNLENGAVIDAIEKVDNEDSSNDVLNFSVATTATTSCSDDVDELERAAAEEILSNSGEEYDNALLKQSCNHDDFRFSNVSDAYSIVSNSLSDGWNSDGSTNGNNNAFIQSSVMTSNDKTAQSNHGTSLPIGKSSRGCFTHGINLDSSIDKKCQWSNVVSAAYNELCQTECSSYGRSSSDIQTTSSENRGRQSRKSCCAIDIKGSTGKDNSHSIWKKTLKNDVDEHVCQPENANPIHSTFDASKEALLCARQDAFVGLGNSKHERPNSPAYLDEMSAHMDAVESLSNAVDLEASSLKSDDDRSWKKVSGKSKKKQNSGSKQEHNNCSRKGAYASKYELPSSMKMNEQKEMLGISSIVNHQKSVHVSSRSPHNIHNHARRASLKDQTNYSSVESIQNQVFLRESKLPDDVHHAMSNSHAHTTQNQINLLSRVLNPSEKACQLEVDSNSTYARDLPRDTQLSRVKESNMVERLENDVPDAHGCMQDHNFGSILQKCFPVERKDAEILNPNGSGHIPVPYHDATHTDGLSSSKESSLYSPYCVSSSSNESTCFGMSIDFVDHASLQDEGPSDKSRSSTLRMPKEHDSKHLACNSSTHKSNDQVTFLGDIDSFKMAQVVNDAYRLQIESEGVQLATGSPLADFERLLHSASPVLDETCSVQQCNYCSEDLLIGDSLCRHHIHNIPLSSIWQWYERPGSYGLEVRADGYYNSKRSGSDQLGFCAYFVPFLSAVQLFSHSGDSKCTSRAIPGSEVVKICDEDVFSEDSSNLSHSPLFCMCQPQPARERRRGFSSRLSAMHASQPLWSLSQDGICCSSHRSECVCEPDLLFEYFESEQPQQRRPLFDKIKELVRGDSASSFQAFGDPSKLNSMRLHDIHPSSWYSVAWYPIYRIPDGSFRAAFLTYHSLGLFIRRKTSPNFHSGDTCIVSPVVGLQSYNAQGECWFQLRNSMAVQTEGTPHFDLSMVLKDRLRTLEQTASDMARALVRKGGQTSMNRHPDYEFFLSRKW